MKRGPPHDDQTGNADSVSVPSHGGLGDLISDRTLGFWGSAGSASGFSPIERVLLSANGNLQRLVSSYLNSHVTVTVNHSTKKSHGVYEREVALLAQGQEFGVATSTVTLSRDDCIDAVDRRGVAIGQMFRHLNIMPRFTLHRFGEQADGRIWREYTLEGSGVCCRILEQLSRTIFELPPPAAAPPPAAPPPAAPPPAAPDAAAPAAAAPVTAALDAAAPPAAVGGGTFGDIMSANTTGIELPSGFTAMQRLLLTANGNVERIVRAYYDEEVRVHACTCVRTRAVSIRTTHAALALQVHMSVLEISPVSPLYLPGAHVRARELASRAGRVRAQGGDACARGGDHAGVLGRSPRQPRSQPPALPCSHPSSRSHTSPSAPRTEQARSMVYITDEAWLDATERQQVMGRWAGGWAGGEWMRAWVWSVLMDGCAAAYADDYHATRSLPPHPLLLAAHDRQVDVSEMFHHMGVLPTFTLHSAGLCPGATPTHFWRVYSIKTSGMTCEITETFVADVLDRPPTAVKPPKRSSLDHNGF